MTRRTAGDARRNPMKGDVWKKRNVTRHVTGLFINADGATNIVQCRDNYSTGGVTHPWPRLAQFQAWANGAEAVNVAQTGGEGFERKR